MCGAENVRSPQLFCKEGERRFALRSAEARTVQSEPHGRPDVVIIGCFEGSHVTGAKLADLRQAPTTP